MTWTVYNAVECFCQRFQKQLLVN